MSNHDSWVSVTESSPYKTLLGLFPNGFPVRDPFPMYSGKKKNGETVALWAIDIERLNMDECEAIALAIALQKGADPDDVLEEAIEAGSFGLDDKWVVGLEIGAEGYARTLELREFMLTHPSMTESTSQAMRDFVQDQIERWIDGDEVPPPLPVSIDEVPKELQSLELEAAIKRNNLNYRVGDGTYSVFDVMTGRAMVDVLNKQDSEFTYEIVGFDSLDDD